MTRSNYLNLETRIMEYQVKLKDYQEKALDAQQYEHKELYESAMCVIDACESYLKEAIERYRLATIEKEYEQIEEYCKCCGNPDYVYDYGEYRYCQTCIGESK